MRIGIEANVYYKNLGGGSVYTRNIIDIWRKVLKDNEIILFANRRQSKLDLAKKNIFMRLINGIHDIVWLQVILPVKVIKQRVDILFCPAFLSPVFLPCPTVVTIYDMSFIRFPNLLDPLTIVYLKLFIQLIKKKTYMILTISESSKKEIIELLNVSSEKVKVTYAGVNEKFHVIGDKDKINNIKNKYRTSEYFILNVGTLQPRKNLPTLVEAFNLLREKEKISHKLILCGQRGWYYDGIFQKVKDLGLEKEVVFTGYIPDEDLPVLYSAADVFVYPSLCEGFGLPVLEAMACGCPVVVSNTFSLPEVVGDAGILINDPLNTNELATGILKIIRDKDLRANFIKRGIERSKLFSWNKTASETLKILKEVYDKNRKSYT